MTRALRIALAACMLPLPAAAAEGSNVHAEARTVTTLQRELDPATPGHTRWRAPTWQFLTLRGRELGGGFDVDASAWLVQELAGDHAPERRGDLVFGSVGWRGWDRKLLVRAGRDFIAAGGGRGLVLDGVQATVQLPAYLSLQGYGGWNVTQDGAAFATPALGARLAWSPWLRGHLGASVQQVGSADAPVRRSLGLDASLRWPERLLTTASAAYDLVTERLQQVRLDAVWRPKDWLTGWLRAERRDPLAWLPRDSIFVAFTQDLGDVVGMGADLQTPGALAVAGGYERYLGSAVNAEGYRGHGEVRLRIDQARRWLVGLTGSRLMNSDGGYDQARVWLTARPLAGWRASLDVDAYRFLRKVNGFDRSVAVSAGLRWAGKRGVEAGIDAQVWQNPWYETQAMALATLALADAALRSPPPPRPPPKEADDDEDAGPAALPAAATEADE